MLLTPPIQRSSRRLLVPVLSVLLVADLAGGLLEIAAGRNTLATAWGGTATLCAPLPMFAFQVVAVLVVTRSSRRVARRIAAVLLAAACLVSFLSGSFDGQLTRADLTTAQVAFQWWLLAVTALLGVAAAPWVVEREPVGTAGGAAGPRMRTIGVRPAAEGLRAAGARPARRSCRRGPDPGLVRGSG
jgi:hypothetical protein